VRRNTIAVLMVAWTACVTPSSPDLVETPPGPAPAPSSVSSALVDRTNAERTGAGLATLRADSRLMQAAQIHAEQMAAAGRMEHTLPDARYPRLEDRLAAVAYRWQAIGENVAAGQRDAAQVVQDWMGSSGHRANILNANFTEMGAGYIVDGSGRTYWVQVFARPAS
jgi:uncharacterized protein YkwD